MTTGIICLVIGGALVLIVLLSGLWTASLARGILSNSIRLVTVSTVVGMGWVFYALFFPGEPTAEGILVKAGDAIVLPESGAGILLLEAKLLDEKMEPGRANLADILVAGAEGKVRENMRFVLFDAAADFDDDEPPEKQRRFFSRGIPNFGKDMKIKLMDLQPEGGIHVKASWRQTGVFVEHVAWAIVLLMLLGAFLEAAVPNGSARTFLTVTLATAAALMWNIRIGLPPSGAITGLLGALGYSFMFGAIVGSLLPGFLTRFVPEATDTNRGHDG